MRPTSPDQPGAEVIQHQDRREFHKPQHTIRTVLSLLIPLALLFTGLPAAQAQVVSLANQTTIASDLNSPYGLAVDAAGDVFIADVYNNRVVKVSPGGVETTLGSGMNQPTAVAVDATGNVFVADSSNSRVLKISPAGVQTTVASGLSFPFGVAVDGADNVFTSDSGNNRVIKISPDGTQTTVVGTGLNRPFGLAVDAAGDLYIADSGSGRVLKVTPGGVQTTVAGGLFLPYAVAVDTGGTVYIGQDAQVPVLKVSPDGTQATVGSGSYALGVAVDRAGNVFYTNLNTVVKLSAAALDFGPVNICPSGQTSPAPCSQTLTLTYNVTAGGPLKLPAVLTQGAPNLDFKLAGGSTCGGFVLTGTTCTVNVTFAPLAPGLRKGAVELTDSSGNLLATTFVYGQGQGPAIAFGPGTQSTVASGLISPYGTAVDAAGNIFIVNNSSVVKLPAGGGPQTTVISGLNGAIGIAVDGAGNLLIADEVIDHVLKISPTGAQTAVGSGLSSAEGVAVDGAGNVFIADTANNRVVEVPAGGGAQTTVGSGLHFPIGVAVDGTGNVFITDSSNGRVLKVTPTGAQTVVAGGLNGPSGIAVDGAGNVFITYVTGTSAIEVPADGGPQTAIGSGLSQAVGLAVDGAGNVFIADHLNSRVVQVRRSLAPALSFAATAVGSTSSDSPQSVKIQNIGNQPLSAVPPGLNIGANFQQVPGPGTPADCTAGFLLAAGASCNLSISFIPQTAGTLQSTAVLTDNALNAAGATQTMTLSGTATLTTTVTVGAATGQYSDPVTLTALVGPSGTTFNGSLQFQVSGVNACSVPVTGSGTYTCSYTITQAVGTYSIVGTLTSSSVQGSTGSSLLTVTKEDATLVPSATNPSTVQVSSPGGIAGPITLHGVIQQAPDSSLGDINKAVVAVTLLPAVSGGASIICPATNANGTLSAICSNVPVEAYTVEWTVGGNYFQGPQVNSVLAVYDPSLGFVTGGGSVNDNGVAADFSISVKYLKNGTLNGGVTYVEHRASGDVSVNTTTLSSMSLVGTTAIIFGQATVNGTPGYTLQLNVTDNGSPGIHRDMFGLQVSGGALNPSISFAPSAITAGNIQTH